jgi:hypothetical protein
MSASMSAFWPAQGCHSIGDYGQNEMQPLDMLAQFGRQRVHCCGLGEWESLGG